MRKREQQDKILNLGHTIALQAVELAPHERQAFIKSEVAKLRHIYGPIYADEELLDRMGEWVSEIVKILAVDDSLNGADWSQ